MPSRLFIASIGNPGELYNTLHSAGHIMLDAVAAAMQYPAFRRNISENPAATSPALQHALYKSPAYMNESGAPISRAYRKWLRSLPPEDRDGARLLVLHDELELKIGSVKFRSHGSFKGHNGLRSVFTSMGGQPFQRIGIGIGRPESRTSRDVASYVLRKMSPEEKRRIQGRALDAVDMINEMAEKSESASPG